MIYGLPIALALTLISCIVLIRLFIKDKTPISLDFLQGQKAERSKEEKMQRVIVLIVIAVTVLLWLTTTIHGIKVGAVSAVPLVFLTPVSYTHLRAHETPEHLVCRLLLEK